MGQAIQRPDIGAALQRYFALVGRVRPELEEFVLPVVSVGDLAAGGAPPVVRRVTASFSQAAVAAQVFQARFEIPGSMLAVIRQVNINAPGGAALNIRFHQAGNVATIGAQANTAPKSFTDGRLLEENQLAGGVLTFGTQAAALATTESLYRVYAAQSLVLTPDWVVGTGRADLFGFLEFESNTANAAVAGTLMWDEYQIV